MDIQVHHQVNYIFIGTTNTVSDHIIMSDYLYINNKR